MRVLLNLIYSISIICLISTSVARADMKLIPEFDNIFNISGVVQEYYLDNSKSNFVFKGKDFEISLYGKVKIKKKRGISRLNIEGKIKYLNANLINHRYKNIFVSFNRVVDGKKVVIFQCSGKTRKKKDSFRCKDDDIISLVPNFARPNDNVSVTLTTIK